MNKLILAVFLACGIIVLVEGSGDFACYYCKKSYNQEQCNAQGIKYCKSKEQACVTIVEEKKDGSTKMEKKCIDPKSKYCREMPYCKGSKEDKCYYCCYDTLCNVEYPPPQDPCSCEPCRHGGTCSPAGEDGFVCTCAPGYTGTYCEQTDDYQDPCDSAPCRNGGTCFSMEGDWECDCKPCWTGRFCETRTDPCKDNPCENGGSCVPSGDSYRCDCRSGFSGTHCEKEDHPCAGNPCKHGGTCTPHCTGYTCLCYAGFTGTNCETPMEACFHCPAQSGMFFDAFDCQKYYHCTHWVPFHKECPHPLHFNAQHKMCDWPEHADCIPVSIPDDKVEDYYKNKCICAIEQYDFENDFGGGPIGKRDKDVEEEGKGEEGGKGGMRDPDEEKIQKLIEKIDDVLNELEHQDE